MPDQVVGDWGLIEPLGATTASVVLTGDDALLTSLVEVEAALVRAWASETGHDLDDLEMSVTEAVIDRARLVTDGHRDGNPVVGLVAQLRSQAPEATVDWLHRGATSQDILDTALVHLCSRAADHVRAALVEIGLALAARADEYRHTPSVARTLGQQAAPTTFGIIVAGWIDGVGAAIEALDATRFPAQFGGSVGTGLAAAELEGEAAAPDDVRAAFAADLGLSDPGRSWHTERTAVLAIASAFAAVIGTLARIGAVIVEASRAEIAELTASGGGGSSAMPHKQNPIGPILLTSGGQRAPALLATIAGSLVAIDARPPGAWHAEWAALRELAALAVAGVDTALAVVEGLVVDPGAMARNSDLTNGLVHSESALAQLTAEVGRARARQLVDAAIASTHDGVPFDWALAEACGSSVPVPELPSPLFLERADLIVDAALARWDVVRSEPDAADRSSA